MTTEGLDLLPIRAALTTALAAHLGTYTFGEASTPAIRIDDGTDPYPGGEPETEGLECVIQDEPEVAIALVFGGYRQTFRASITLTQWDTNATTLPAMEPLLATLAEFDDVSVVDVLRVKRLSRLDNFETFSVVIQQEFLFD